MRTSAPILTRKATASARPHLALSFFSLRDFGRWAALRSDQEWCAALSVACINVRAVVDQNSKAVNVALGARPVERHHANVVGRWRGYQRATVEDGCQHYCVAALGPE